MPTRPEIVEGRPVSERCPARCSNAFAAVYAQHSGPLVRWLSATFGPYGSVVAGAYATNAGTVVVPRDIVGAKACNTPEALWLDGTEADPANVTTCTPL